MYSINGVGYAETLLEDWEGRSSMCLKPANAKGSNFLQCNEMTHEITSNTNYVKWFRDIAIAFLNFTDEEASRIMSHGDRHIIPNFARILDFSSSSSLEIGRWSDPKDMFLLYSSEVKFLRVLNLVKKVLVFALEKVSFAESSKFPAFGGWERYFPAADGLHAGVDVVTYDEENESELSDDFDEQSSSDSESDEDLDTIPYLPEGWTDENRSTPTGRNYKLYFSPCGHRERSLKQAKIYASRQSEDIISSDDDCDEDIGPQRFLTFDAQRELKPFSLPPDYTLTYMTLSDEEACDGPEIEPSQLILPEGPVENLGGMPSGYVPLDEFVDNSARPSPVHDIPPTSFIPIEEICREHPDCTLLAGHSGLHNLPRGVRATRISRQPSTD